MVGGVAALPSLIGTPGQIWLSVAPVDLRRGIDGLSALVQQTLGTVNLFSNPHHEQATAQEFFVILR